MTHLLLLIIYLAFISLGLPDALLGSAWPVMFSQFGVPVSYAGIVSMLIACGTIVSSLQSDRLTRRFGTGKVTLFSVGMTAAALLGFSFSQEFWQLCLWAIPYGLGAGSVDASLNNYVALHYASRHMSWLHSMWGIGAAAGPSVMAYVLTRGMNWSYGYRYIGIVQLVLTAVLLLSLPLWKRRKRLSGTGGEGEEEKILSLAEIIRLPGAKAVMLVFFAYCAIEQTAGLWAASYLVFHHGLPEESASGFAGLFFIGITIGRLISGFVSYKLNDRQMVNLGFGFIAAGTAGLILLPGSRFALIALVLIGLGCAPIYPSLIHATPYHFGAERSQAVIGVQMASAYVGTSLMPPLFGLLSRYIGIGLFPFYLLIFLLLMIFMHDKLQKRSLGGSQAEA